MPSGTLPSVVRDLEPQDHLCLVYQNPEEHLSAASLYLKAGLERRERCLYVVDEATADAVESALDRVGVAVGDAKSAGALQIVTKRDAYLRDGYFTPDRMIAFLAERTRAAQQDGFGALRLAAEMTWALGNDKGVERLVEYEAKLNHFFKDHACLAACQYNRSRFPAETIRAVVHTHPTVILGQSVARNLFYIPPEEYLEAGEHRVELEVDRMLRQLAALEQSQEALIRSEKLAIAGRIAATVAHEINNPLEALTNLLYLVEHSDTGEERQGYVAQAQSELGRLGAVARQTLGFYREDAGPRTFGLKSVVDEVETLIAPRLLRKRAQFVSGVATDLTVHVNYGELRQVLLNLIANGIDAVDLGGNVGIQASGDAAFVKVEVVDDGTGIPSQYLGSIFEPFFSTKQDHGTGLGLWIVQDLVARQGGSLTVDSHTEGEKKGTVFTLLLPAGRPLG